MLIPWRIKLEGGDADDMAWIMDEEQLKHFTSSRFSLCKAS